MASRHTGVWVPDTDPEKAAPQAATHKLSVGRVESAGLAATNTLEFGINEQTEHALDAAASLQSCSQA